LYSIIGTVYAICVSKIIQEGKVVFACDGKSALTKKWLCKNSDQVRWKTIWYFL